MLLENGGFMLANIRLRDGTYGRDFVHLDLMRFSEEQVRERMRERGIKNDEFIICGILDWGVDTEMSLGHGYVLKRYIETFYDGDETVVVHLLKQHVPIQTIVSHAYRFVSKDEAITLSYLLEKDQRLAQLLQPYIDSGECLNAPNGFYVVET